MKPPKEESVQMLSRQPTGALSLFVDKIWSVQADSLSLSGTNLPMLHSELMFNFSEFFSIQSAGAQPANTGHGCWLSTLQTAPSQSRTIGYHETLGVLLKPWGLYPLTNVPAHEFGRLFVSGEAVFSAAITPLTDAMQQAQSAAEKLIVLEKFLNARYAHKDVPAYLYYADAYLRRQPFRDGIVTELCRHLRISRKSLTETFRKYLGLSPGQYVRLLRFRAAADAIATQPDLSLTDLTYRHDFFDQSHFIHLFRAFADMTPGAYRSYFRTQRRASFGLPETTSPAFIPSGG
ncbi:hypothetical protein BN8_01955 [Fibrisoma limi BUZ 3]|uniref:HTH araC/xylS-type domain-containing protein n=1 Tax=Fibrisoma limi BUZ 3 TaxID=1185876 RepID=I2GG89_9BACT|nr:helix-turn-helix domain-containing protein [Fibrisoma limi]CCH52914.1 hypothetical protein BN8_01955 [Fibrisoma limi BUZ 3]